MCCFLLLLLLSVNVRYCPIWRVFCLFVCLCLFVFVCCCGFVYCLLSLVFCYLFVCFGVYVCFCLATFCQGQVLYTTCMSLCMH